MSACLRRAQSCCSTTARRTCSSWTSPRASRTTSMRTKWGLMRLRRCPHAPSPSTTPRATSSASPTPTTRAHIHPLHHVFGIMQHLQPVIDIMQHRVCCAHTATRCWFVLRSFTSAATWALLDEITILELPPSPDAGRESDCGKDNNRLTLTCRGSIKTTFSAPQFSEDIHPTQATHYQVGLK